MGASTHEGVDATCPSSASCPESPDDVAAQRRLVAALGVTIGRNGGTAARLIETHISFVLLTGGFAYKIKKAVSLGFLDFRTLQARRFFCDEELRLNLRLAPDIYVDVVPIAGTVESPTLDGSGPIIEYAVRMREFPQASLAVHALERGEFSARQVSALAAHVASFHQSAGHAAARGRLGAPDVILHIALQNFSQLRPLISSSADLRDLDALEGWTLAQHAACASLMAKRRDEGFVRECHGDLHLGNIAVVKAQPVVFDCIEFNETMRWIDVMNEIAFTAMDLRERGRADLAHRFIDAYLAITGDYAGLAVLRFYFVYRAMVRAKITRMRAHQRGPDSSAEGDIAEYARYVRLAKDYAKTPAAAIVVTHGLSGSGKSTVAQALVEASGAVRIRTDVERKRLYGSDPAEQRHRGAIDAGLYAPAATRTTYEHVLALARQAAAAGFVTIIDGAFLKRWQRELFRDLATEISIPFVLLACSARTDALRERIEQRFSLGDDASEADGAVLDYQLKTYEPLPPDESNHAIVIDTEARIDGAYGALLWASVRDRIARGSARMPNCASPEVPAA